MDQYIRTPLHLPHLRVRTEATNSFINDVPSYVIHGDLDEPNYREAEGESRSGLSAVGRESRSELMTKKQFEMLKNGFIN